MACARCCNNSQVDIRQRPELVWRVTCSPWRLQGATVLDFAYHVHTDIGNQMIGAKINGKYVTANHQLANSEIVDILTYAGPLTRNVVARHQVCLALRPRAVWTTPQHHCQCCVASPACCTVPRQTVYVAQSKGGFGVDHVLLSAK